MSKPAIRRWKRIFRNHEITIVVREFQENEDDFTGDSGEDLLTVVEEKGKKGSDFSSKQVKVKEEPARPSTPPASGPATQTPLSLSSPQPLPRPKAPVPPETPPRQGICDNAIELLEPMGDNVGEEEEEEKEEEKDQAPPAQGTMPAANGKAKAKKRGLKK